MLHNLFAQDDREFHAPATWEVMFPSPPPFAGQENYPRIKRAQTNLAWFNLLAPEFRIEVSQRPVRQPLLCDGLIRVRKGPVEL